MCVHADIRVSLWLLLKVFYFGIITTTSLPYKLIVIHINSILLIRLYWKTQHKTTNVLISRKIPTEMLPEKQQIIPLKVLMLGRRNSFVRSWEQRVPLGPRCVLTLFLTGQKWTLMPRQLHIRTLLCFRAEWKLTTSVQPVHAVNVVLAHRSGLAENQVGIALRDNRFQAVFGEGSASRGEEEHQEQNPHTHT